MSNPKYDQNKEKDRLFDNPMVQQAKKSLSQKDIERYQYLGEELYKNIDFEKASVNNIPPPIQNALAYIENMINSGLHPSVLEEDEKNILKEIYGEEWYKNFGYIKEDLDDIVTIKME